MLVRVFAPLAWLPILIGFRFHLARVFFGFTLNLSLCIQSYSLSPRGGRLPISTRRVLTFVSLCKVFEAMLLGRFVLTGFSSVLAEDAFRPESHFFLISIWVSPSPSVQCALFLPAHKWSARACHPSNVYYLIPTFTH